MSRSYKLIYFNLKGRAEISRLLFAVAGVKYEDVRIEFTDWPPLKSTMPFEQLPMLEVDGKKYAQSLAIARYLANEFGLYGNNNEERLQIDQIVEVIKDYIFYLDKSFKESDKEKKSQYMKEAIELHSLKYMKYLENLYKECETEFYVGTKLSLADIAVFDILDYITERNAGAVEGFPQLKEFREIIGNIDSIKKYVEQRK